MDDVYAIIGIGLSIFAFLLLLMGIGAYAGGDWETVAIGITPYMIIITGFAFACFILWRLITGRR